MKSLAVSLVVGLFALSAASAVGTVDPATVGRLSVPGPYVGPGPEAVPEGWYSWDEPAAAASSEFQQCGKYKLVFRNPDLQRDKVTEKVHATNAFFIQFQAVGAGAEEVTRFSFSFGKSHEDINENPVINCRSEIQQNPAGQGTGGAYLMYYRSDFDPSDGFFVPVITTNVPDGEYAAAVHAYNAAGDEVARAWTLAVVENCVDVDSDLCNTGDWRRNDRVMPWPMILPGDGEQTNDVDGMTIEFGEKIDPKTLSVSINGEPLAAEEWEPPARDTDLQPLNDPDNGQHPLHDCLDGQVQARNFCYREVYHSGFKVEGVNVEEGDVIRVSAKDNSGNLATKTIHFGKDNSGGAVDSVCPEVSWELLSGADNVALAPSSTFDFNFRLANLGQQNAHVNLVTRYNDTIGLNAKYTGIEGEHPHNDGLVHMELQGGEQNKLNLTLTTDATAVEGTYPVDAILDYNCAGTPVERAIPLQIKIQEGATGGSSTVLEETEPEENETVEEADVVAEEETPGPSLVLALAVLAAVAFAARRRRD